MPLIVLPALLTHALSARFVDSLGQKLKVVVNESPAVMPQSGFSLGTIRIPADTVAADAAALTEFDSSALAVLLECRRQAFALNQKFMVLNMPPRLQQLANLYGVHSLLKSAASD